MARQEERELAGEATKVNSHKQAGIAASKTQPSDKRPTARPEPASRCARQLKTRSAPSQAPTTSKHSSPSATAARARAISTGSAELKATTPALPGSVSTTQAGASARNPSLLAPRSRANPVARARQMSATSAAASSPEPVENVPTAIPPGRVTTALQKRAGNRHSQNSADSPVGETRRMLPTRMKAPCSKYGDGVSYSSSTTLVWPWYNRVNVISRSSTVSPHRARNSGRQLRRAAVSSTLLPQGRCLGCSNFCILTDCAEASSGRPPLANVLQLLLPDAGRRPP